VDDPAVIYLTLRPQRSGNVTDTIECQHVPVNAGFVVARTVSQFVPGTRETFEDLRYVLERRGPGRDDIKSERPR
jgi:hypothetical protein